MSVERPSRGNNVVDITELRAFIKESEALLLRAKSVIDAAKYSIPLKSLSFAGSENGEWPVELKKEQTALGAVESAYEELKEWKKLAQDNPLDNVKLHVARDVKASLESALFEFKIYA